MIFYYKRIEIDNNIITNNDKGKEIIISKKGNILL